MSRSKGNATIRQAVELAVSEGVEHPLIQSGKVFGESVCWGCGRTGVFLFDRVGCWCPADGGLELVPGAIDLDYTITTGKASIGGSAVIHLVESRRAKTTLCLPAATIGRMLSSRADVTCPHCLAIRDGVADQTKEHADA